MKVEVTQFFEDDHLPCCAFRVDGRRAEIWWSGFDVCAALAYADESPRAHKIVDRLLYLVITPDAPLLPSEEEGDDINNDSIREIHTHKGFLVIKRD